MQGVMPLQTYHGKHCTFSYWYYLQSLQ